MAYLRLLGIARGKERSARLVRVAYLRPDCAVGLFRTGPGWFVMVAFSGEAHWIELSLKEADGLVDFEERLTWLLTNAPGCR